MEALPYAIQRTRIKFPESTNAFSATHFEISIPNGARYIPAIPIPIMYASFGTRMISPCMSSMSREPSVFSVAPTDWNSMDLLTEWKIIRKTAAQTVSSAPIPAQPTISPRFDIVENARTFFPSFWAIAIILAMIKVNPPILDTRIPTRFPWNAGEIRSSRYTPAFTIVALWSRALDGVGATMAPRSQVENGS